MVQVGGLNSLAVEVYSVCQTRSPKGFDWLLRVLIALHQIGNLDQYMLVNLVV